MIKKEQKERYIKSNKASINYDYLEACSSGNIDVVRYLLTSSDLQVKVWENNQFVFCNYNPAVKANDSEGLRRAILRGKLEIVKYLLTSDDLKEHADIHAANDYALRTSCEYGFLDIVKFLLEDLELKDSGAIHAVNDYGLVMSSFRGHDHLVKYLLNTAVFNDDALFETLTCAAEEGHLKIVSYLVFEYNIEYTQKIKDWFLKIREHGAQKHIFNSIMATEEMFKSRDEKINLINCIKNNSLKSSKTKL